MRIGYAVGSLRDEFCLNPLLLRCFLGRFFTIRYRVCIPQYDSIWSVDCHVLYSWKAWFGGTRPGRRQVRDGLELGLRDYCCLFFCLFFLQLLAIAS